MFQVDCIARYIWQPFIWFLQTARFMLPHVIKVTWSKMSEFARPILAAEGAYFGEDPLTCTFKFLSNVQISVKCSQLCELPPPPQIFIAKHNTNLVFCMESDCALQAISETDTDIDSSFLTDEWQLSWSGASYCHDWWLIPTVTKG